MGGEKDSPRTPCPTAPRRTPSSDTDILVSMRRRQKGRSAGVHSGAPAPKHGPSGYLQVVTRLVCEKTRNEALSSWNFFPSKGTVTTVTATRHEEVPAIA